MQHHVQPRESAPTNQQVREEIQNFLEAVDSYPDRVAKEPGVSFRQHLCSFFVEARDPRQGDHSPDHLGHDRRDDRPRRG